FAWRDDFSAARNESLRHATGRWILWLDADDRIYPDQHGKIRKLARQPANRAFQFILQNRGVENARCLQLRMFPNVPGVRFERPVHEQVVTSLQRLNIPLQNTDIVLEHTGYHSEEIVRRKKERYIRMMRSWLEKNPGDFAIQYQLGLALHTLKRNKEAAEVFQRLLETIPAEQQHDPAYLHSLILYGRTLLNLGRLDEALAPLQKAVQMQPGFSFARMSLAELFVARAEYGKAEEILKNISDERFAKEVSSFPLDYSVLRYGKYALLGKSLIEQGREEEGLRALKQAVEIRPDRPEAHKFAAEYWEMKGNWQSAAESWQRAAERKRDVYPRFRLAGVFVKMNRLPAAERELRNVLQERPDLVPAWLNLGRTLRAEGKFEDAGKLFQMVQERFPHAKEAWFEFHLSEWDARQAGPGLHGQAADSALLGNLLLEIPDPVPSGTGTGSMARPEDTQTPFSYALVKKELLLWQSSVQTGREPGKEFWLSLAQIQLDNHRIFQAIVSLENAAQKAQNVRELVEILTRIAQCYEWLELPAVAAKIAEQARKMAAQVQPQLA
ncbi:MAG TPA: tetratricopeptide repeat protein, partial [Bacteroidetes bacterium]|nr:tetratricopeptide repeat protein [Bacteroidota bacterium]